MNEEDRQLLEKMEKYSQGLLTDEEKTAFEKACQNDPELNESYQAFLLGRYAVWETGYEEQKKNLENLFYENQANIKPFQPNRRRWVQFAAAVIGLLVLISGIWYFSPNPKSNEEIFATFYERPRVPETMGTSPEQVFKAAGNHYQKEEFAEAIVEYQAYLADSSSTRISEAWFFQGVSNLELNRFDEAIDCFSKAESFPEQGDWLTALALIKAGNKDAAIDAFKKIAEYEGHFYQEQAKDVLGDF